MRKSRNDIIRLVIYIVVAIISFLADIFVFNEISLTHINTLVTTCFSALVSIAGIWVACYLLFLELFRDRYQMQFLKKNLYTSMKENFFFVIYCLFFGTIVMALSIGVISAIVFSALTIVTIAEILIKIFKANKSLMINSHIDKLQQELEEKIKTGKKLAFSELKDYRSIDLLRNFSSDEKTLYFILRFPERKEQLYRSLFNIGTNCIENNYEEGVRRISNTLGWSIISCLKQPYAESTNYLIDRAIDLYDISTKMKTSITTQVFIVTLFTTVGAFCCKDAKLYPFRNRIIEKLNVPMETIETAATLRTCESDTWNDLFENKTEQLTNEFLKVYREKHSLK